MKMHILFPLKDTPNGGGNQFLLALKQRFIDLGYCAERAEDANVIIFNSYPFGAAYQLYSQVARLRSNAKKPVAVVHRVDGPIAVVRGSARDLPVDRSIASFNNFLADATVFQSKWSRAICHDFGIGVGKPEIVIGNAPDNRWFYRPVQRVPLRPGDRVRVIASSWSSNWRKGFDIYRYLDHALDHDRYEFIFVGNTPVQFDSIRIVPPVCSRELGDLLRGAHIYLTASIDDPCSNAVVEALHCGLPIVARTSGGHPELVGANGALFTGHDDVISTLDRVAAALAELPVSNLPTMEIVADAYLEFARQILDQPPPRAVCPGSGTLLSLYSTVAIQRYWSSITRKVTRALPLREARFHSVPPAFRHASWEPPVDVVWTYKEAYEWIKGVVDRLPLFLDSMRHPSQPKLYRYSLSGDLQTQPSLASSVFAGKIIAMANLNDAESATTLVDHIQSFQHSDGAIADPWVAAHSRWGRLFDALRSRSTSNLFHRQTIRAETRQAFAALRALGAVPRLPFADLPQGEAAITSYVQNLNWKRPWGAASHISHLAFFMSQHSLCFGEGDSTAATRLLMQVERIYRREDGAWYEAGASISSNQKVNGAMKMVTALDAAGSIGLTNPEGLIDLCLAAVNEGHACNHFNVICVLHRCAKLTDYRKSEVHNYMLGRLRLYHTHYWPWQGGFSFFQNAANHSYYNARVTTGMAEPDLHGTVLLLWGIVLISDTLEWMSSLRLSRTIV